ncbi:MAG: hypothetical protein JW763_07030 [candidate division Zixibacteria bacterium]|nr:hypothetical protein [candidate division Zixibacteria bacterium]
MNDANNTMAWHDLLSRPLVNFIVVLLGMAAAYFTTIGGIRVQLAEKAEAALVEALDCRLARMEVMISEGLINKDDFHEFRTTVESRLSRIESCLTDNKGDKK